MKKFISIILTVLMIVGTIPAAFAAEGDYTVSGISADAELLMNVGIKNNVTVTPKDDTVLNNTKSIKFKVDNVVAFEDSESPFVWDAKADKGSHTLAVVAVKNDDSEETISSYAFDAVYYGAPVIDVTEDFEADPTAEGYTPPTFTKTGNGDGSAEIVETALLGGAKALKLAGGSNYNGSSADATYFIEPGSLFKNYWNLGIKKVVQEFDIYKDSQYGRISLVYGYPAWATAFGSYDKLYPENSTDFVDQKVHFTVVTDIENDTITTYRDGEQIGTMAMRYPSEWNQNNSTNRGYGVGFQLFYGSSYPFYVDDFKIKAYAASAPDFTADISVEEGTTDYKITFSNDLKDAETAAGFINLRDAEGNVISDSVSKSSGDDYVTLSVDEDNIPDIVNCKIVIDKGEVVDEFGQTFGGATYPFSEFKVTGITMESELSLVKEETATIVPVVTPDSAVNKAVTWTSSDDAVATVTDDGEVTGVSKGMAKITATTVDGGYTAECLVTVTNPTVSASSGSIRPVVVFDEDASDVASAGRWGNDGGVGSRTTTTDYVRMGKYSVRYTGPAKYSDNWGYKISGFDPIIAKRGDVYKYWVYNAGNTDVLLCKYINPKEYTDKTDESGWAEQYSAVTLPAKQWTLVTHKLGKSGNDTPGTYTNFQLVSYTTIDQTIANTNNANVDLYFNQPWIETGEHPFTVSKTTYADEETGISVRVPNYRVTFSNNLNDKDKAMAAVSLVDKNGATVSSVVKSAGANYVDLAIYDNVTLNYNETYKVKVNTADLYDVIGQKLSGDTEFTFTTAEEGENLRPNVEIKGIVDYERFMEDDQIYLSAAASDEDGEITEVKFYCNETLIGTATTIDELGLYSVVWEDVPASASFTDYFSITAVAVDDEGKTSVSEAKNILVYNEQSPELTVEVADTFYDNVAGAKVDMVKISGTNSDLDGTVKSIEILIDGDSKTVINDPKASYSYDNTEEYAPGLHTVKVIATDSDGNTTEVEKEFTSIVVSKKYPAFQTEALTDKMNKAKWEITEAGGTVAFGTERGVVITSTEEGRSSAKRTVGNASMSGKAWQIDVMVKFNGTSNIRTVEMLGKKLVIFNEDGTITSDVATLEGMKYAADTNYTISLIGNPSKGYAACLLNGNLIKDRIEITTDLVKSGVSLLVSQDGKDGELAETVISSYGAYDVGECASSINAKLFKTDGTAANLSAVPVTPGYITVDIDGGVSKDVVLTDAVQLIDNVTGRACALELENGKLMIKETLAYGSTYTINVTTGLYNAAGKTYPGVHNVTFTTETKAIVADREAAGFTADEIASDATSVTFGTTVKNTSGSPKSVYVFCVVYEGKKAVGITMETVTIPAGGAATPVSATTPISVVTENTTAEGFILESLTNLTSVTDEIYSID